ncbi:DMT family transporter [Thermanaerothrix sp. 4228-RoL]|uniref:DMT family transporter n=1 Tax=Thermanaerothrix solaris TaxID=3058434 RepID=A0ABU3NNK5_9CHLR|nr:DMT family transporter [Thermanaerothrix sp. 4228-RoL]MDT8897396.1 DMT family transporter [Thermanaerothrix sp. 4228-RoL]
MKNTRLKSDLILLLVAVIWGSGFVAQKIAAAEVDNFVFNGLRFTIGGLLLILGLRLHLPSKAREWKWIFLGGTLLFGGSTLQQIGITSTTAANAGFITGLYVVIIPLLLFLFGRQRPGWYVWLAAGMAVLGTLLLSSGSLQVRLNPGDTIILGGAFIWALHVITVGQAAQRMNAFIFAAGQALVCGLLNLAIVGNLLPQKLHAISPATLTATIYSAVFIVGLAFTLQVIGQRHAPPADAAILFSSEAVFAALFGALLLGEKLQPTQWLGALLIFVAMLLSQGQVLLTASSPSPSTVRAQPAESALDD